MGPATFLRCALERRFNHGGLVLFRQRFICGRRQAQPADLKSLSSKSEARVSWSGECLHPPLFGSSGIPRTAGWVRVVLTRSAPGPTDDFDDLGDGIERLANFEAATTKPRNRSNGSSQQRPRRLPDQARPTPTRRTRPRARLGVPVRNSVSSSKPASRVITSAGARDIRTTATGPTASRARRCRGIFLRQLSLVVCSTLQTENVKSTCSWGIVGNDSRATAL